ncbi:MAG: ABC transporter ATP-binding protein [Thiotrichales bacterium]|jgi:ABC-2 type transport system ATP-binding protein|nr:ABC transporter ATP-binding protein [Thiotrichales bacterium]MBT3854795.1 ABC transporter ATP-binding protein [Thiotrichales bacterium]MBT4653270.1 ABC transporter ATP-binding protein [Thiotrichales bacterium]MBT5500253.1 ABC transporter ATP-binding protein [Thiotrichales bacterium]MBT6770966.1 ABC transporter ATP-binding protein [Thiotrichales bacterium]
MSLALSTLNLAKTYSNKLEALKGINLRVEKGDFFALLGSNGAGKTTAIGIIAGLLKRTSGEVLINGLDQKLHTNEVKKMIGLMPQEFNFNPHEPNMEILINQAGYFGIPRNDAKIQAEVLLKKMELWDRRFDVAQSLSGGMKRRLMLARALMHKPSILILDEPTAGVDVEIRQSMWHYLTQLNKEGMTIILTTHYLEEAESLCRNIAILNNGVLVEQSNMKKLLSKAKKQVIILDTVEKLNSNIKINDCDCKLIDDYTLQVALGDGTSISDVVSSLSAKNIHVSHLRSSQNRLEGLFLSLTS